MYDIERNWLPPAESRPAWARPFIWHEAGGWRAGYDAEGHVTDLVDLATSEGYFRLKDGSWCAGTWHNGEARRVAVPCHTVYNVVRGARLPPIVDPVNLDSDPIQEPPPPPTVPDAVPQKRLFI